LLLYIQFIVFTAGTLLAFFWMVVILGHRRQRNFERVLFFLCLALFFFYGASLLEFNALVYFANLPPKLAMFAWIFVCLGLTLIPALFLHLQIEYAAIRELLTSRKWKSLWLLISYAPLLYFLPRLGVLLRASETYDFITPVNALGSAYKIWLVSALLVAVAWQWWFADVAPESEQKRFHRSLVYYLPLTVLGVAAIHFAPEFTAPLSAQVAAQVHLGSSMLLAVLPLIPLGALVHNVEKFNFLQLGRQRNLMYAVFLTFLALLYLSLVRRVSLWLAPNLPPETTAAILLFVPVVFFEPIQRRLRSSLRQTAHSEIDRTQRMMGPIQEAARLGDVAKLKAFTERWIRQQLQLAEALMNLTALETAEGGEAAQQVAETESWDCFPIQQAGRRIGELRVKAHGAMLSGETVAALEYLCEQFPAALDLCRLIEEKLQLERDLAERERLAVLGQMAASISHNLKNPLGSIKTILQVQLENRELPESIRGETKMVLEEIARLSGKLNQLLQFSRPVVRGASADAGCDPDAVAEQVAALLRHEAERRHVKLETQFSSAGRRVAVSAESVNDIVTNLLVNALEAAHRGGCVRLSSRGDSNSVQMFVEDNGPGIPDSAKEKIWQPFFTTKAQGTGLGLAIVARRVAECGGQVEWESPAKDGRGARFCVTLPIEEARKQ
jgi:signal transduction histidine kinase